MIFKIGDKTFSGDMTEELIKNISESLLAIPEPTLLPDNCLFIDIDPKTTVLCLQREIAYIDAAYKHNQIVHIGTKNLRSCLCAIIYSDMDYLIMHIDTNHTVNLFEQMVKFKKKENISISLIGGFECEESINNLEFFLEELYKCFLQMTETREEVNFEIVSQKTIERNIRTEESKYYAAYDYLVKQITILTESYFKKSCFEFIGEKKTVNDMRNNKKIKMTMDSDLAIVFQAVALASRCPLDFSHKKICELIKNKFINLANTVSEDKLANLFRNLFCADVFDTIDMILQKTNSYPGSNITNFVFDINTKNIIRIPADFPTPQESLRDLAILDINIPYNLCFYGNNWIKSFLLKDTIKYINEVKEYLSEKTIDYSSLKQNRGWDIVHLDRIMRYINDLPKLEEDIYNRPLKLSGDFKYLSKTTKNCVSTFFTCMMIKRKHGTLNIPKPVLHLIGEKIAENTSSPTMKK